MPRRSPSPDRSSALAFIAFAAAATTWIAVMAAQPRTDALQASAWVISPAVAMAQPQQPRPLQLADLSR